MATCAAPICWQLPMCATMCAQHTNRPHIDSSLLPCFHPQLWAPDAFTNNTEERKQKSTKNARVANTLSGKSRNEAFPPSWAAGSLWWVAGWVPEKQGVCYCTLSPLSSPFPVGSLTSRPRTPFQILSTCCGPPNKKLTCQKKEIGFQWN